MNNIKAIYVFLVFNMLMYSAKSQHIYNQHIELTDSSYISLFTCDPGNELYSSFGHSAIGVFDPSKGLNVIFNYGTFSFNTPNFYLKFASGKLNYKLSIESYKSFLYEYERDGRMVLSEELNLTLVQKQKLFDALLNNYKPENREYQYDFFFDNCATRIIDMLESVLGKDLKHNEQDSTKRETFRNLIDTYLNQGSWSDVGIDLALGAVIDASATEKQKTFLPHYLSQYVNNSTIQKTPLVKKAEIVVPDTIKYTSTPIMLRPIFIFWTLFAIVLIITLLNVNKKRIVTDRIVFFIVGLMGIVTALLCFATDHQAAAQNWNLLWANPLYIIFVFFISEKSNYIRKYLALLFLLLNICTLLFWNIIPQQYNFVFIPIIATVSVRLSAIARQEWKNKQN